MNKNTWNHDFYNITLLLEPLWVLRSFDVQCVRKNILECEDKTYFGLHNYEQTSARKTVTVQLILLYKPELLERKKNKTRSQNVIVTATPKISTARIYNGLLSIRPHQKSNFENSQFAEHIMLYWVLNIFLTAWV